jgi:hypothetical protein
VIDDFMDVLLRCKVVISPIAIRINGGTALNLIQDSVLKSLALDVWHGLSANLAAATVKHTHNNSLADKKLSH